MEKLRFKERISVICPRSQCQRIWDWLSNDRGLFISPPSSRLFIHFCRPSTWEDEVGGS
jgi:hypothetical protein